VHITFADLMGRGRRCAATNRGRRCAADRGRSEEGCLRRLRHPHGGDTETYYASVAGHGRPNVQFINLKDERQ
jgi:hypothetical protein